MTGEMKERQILWNLAKHMGVGAFLVTFLAVKKSPGRWNPWAAIERLTLS
jgi:hypothetical protein